MRFGRGAFLSAFLLAAACGQGGYGQTKEAVMGVLKGVAADGRTLSGQQVNEYEVFIECTSFERIHELTGKWPAILGLELMFIIENSSYREYFMQRAIEHAARGGIVALTWHARNPLRVCPRGEYYKCSQIAMSDNELARILTDGTDEHRLWEQDVDAIADVIKEMNKRGIAPVFRPYHEMNGGWFWWGEKSRYDELWRMLHHRFTDHHGLTNLVWAWSPDNISAGAQRYYPGNEFVDFVGADIYTNDREADVFEVSKRNVASLHPSGVFALTEVGKLPSPDIFVRVAPAYFLLWGGEFINAGWSADACDKCNRAEDVKAIYALPEVVTLDELEWPRSANVKFIPKRRSAGPEISCPATLIPQAMGAYHE